MSLLPHLTRFMQGPAKLRLLLAICLGFAPLVGPTATAADNLFLFELDGRYPLEGKIVTRRMVSERPRHLYSYDFPDRLERVQISSTQVLTRHGEVRREDPLTGEPLDFTVRFTEGTDQRVVRRLSQRVNDRRVEHPLLGHTVRVRKIGDTWVTSLQGADPTPAQVAAMEELKLDDDAPPLYPAQPVPIGHSWNPPASAFLGKRTADSFNAQATLMLDAVERVNGEPIALISVEITGDALQNEDRERTVGMRGSFEMRGQLRRNLRTFLDESLSLEGTLSVRGLFRTGETQTIPIAAEGPWTLNVTETLR